MSKVHIKKGDKVRVLWGSDKGAIGEVLSVVPEKGMAIVEKVNMRTMHLKPKPNGEQGGRINKERPISTSKLMRICNKCGMATKAAKVILSDGSKGRICKKCGEILDIIKKKSN